MNRETSADMLDRELESFVAGRSQKAHPEWQRFLEIAADLRQLANPEFKSRLKLDLLERIGSLESPRADFEQVTGAREFAEALPTLGGSPHLFPPDQRSFLVSFISHTALIALIASGIWGGRSAIVRQTRPNSELTYMPTGNGGGGSGNHDRLPATKGTPPKLKERQLAPPAIVVRRPAPRLELQASVVGPPDIKFPESASIAGPMASSNLVFPSNGAGTGGGAGSGSGAGLGAGTGLGVGPGSYHGFGGGAFRARGGMLAPRAIYDPEPEYSEEARKVKLQGTVLLSLVVDVQGRPRDIRVIRSLGMGLDERAIEAVKRWKFTPGTKDGIAVSTEVNVEVSFRLY